MNVSPATGIAQSTGKQDTVSVILMPHSGGMEAYMNLTEKIFDFARRDSDGLYSISVIEGGEINTLKRVPSNNANNTYSVSKAFTVTALGILYDEGKLCTDEHITDIFSDEMPDGYDPVWDRVTVDNVIKHSTGIDIPGFINVNVDDLSEYEDKYGTRTDFLSILLSQKLPYEPGTYHCYTDAAYYLLSRLVTKKSGERLDDFLNKRLFVPLDFSEIAWEKCPQGYPLGGTGLFLRAADVAKLGQTYLCGGVYDGKRIFSEEWCNTVKEREYEFSKCSEFGHGKGGYCGQFVYFNTKLGIAVGWEGYDTSDYGARLCDFLKNLEMGM